MIPLLCALAPAEPVPYVGIDPLALATFPRGVVSRAVLPFFTGFESGVALQGGVFLDPHDAFELRLSAGPSHPDTLVTQVHVGYARYFLDRHLLAGVYLRWVDNAGLRTGEQFYSLSPYVTVGGRAHLGGPVYGDARVGWDFASFAWSSVEHSVPGVGFVQMPPFLLFDVQIEL